jgi:hypothetical protein
LDENMQIGPRDEREGRILAHVRKPDIGLRSGANGQGKIRVRAGAPAANIVNDDVAGQIFS